MLLLAVVALVLMVILGFQSGVEESLSASINRQIRRTEAMIGGCRMGSCSSGSEGVFTAAPSGDLLGVKSLVHLRQPKSTACRSGRELIPKTCRRRRLRHGRRRQDAHDRPGRPGDRGLDVGSSLQERGTVWRRRHLRRHRTRALERPTNRRSRARSWPTSAFFQHTIGP